MEDFGLSLNLIFIRGKVRDVEFVSSVVEYSAGKGVIV